MAKSIDKDLGFKLRFRRILFMQGYWSPIEVELSQYEDLGVSLQRKSLTDLDVLGIKYDNLFTPFRVVGDCKSGRKVSDANRLFWLKGIKNYFGADQAYFIHTTIKNHTRGIAPKLGLRVLDEKSIVMLEETLQAGNYFLPLDNIQIQTDISSKWGITVKKGDKLTQEQLLLKEVYSYLSYSYWYMDQHRNLLNSLESFIKIAEILDDQNKSHELIAYTGLERFAHSLLETASCVQAQGGINIPRDTRSYIFGGPTSLKEKENFFQLLRTLTGSNEQLDPPYLTEIIELLSRLIKNPSGASDVLRHIQAIYLWCAHLNNNGLKPLNGNNENTPAIVLTRDIANAFSKITGIKKSFFNEIFSL